MAMSECDQKLRYDSYAHAQYKLAETSLNNWRDVGQPQVAIPTFLVIYWYVLVVVVRS